MAVIASASITLTSITDVASTTRYYKLQSSTLAKPAKPTAKPPSGWTTTEPTYAAVATSSLYTCDLTVFSDGTYAYSDVSLSSSYEAAKDAYNQAIEAAKTASNYMEYTSAGLDVGNKASGKWTGFRTRMAESAFQVLDAAGAVLASYGASVVELGRSTKTAVIKLCGGIGEMAGAVGGTRDLFKISSNGDLWIKGYGVTVEGDHLELVGTVGATVNGRSVPGMESSDGYWGLVAPDGSASAYVRTTSSGIIPYKSGGASSIGTAGWPFNSIYGKAVYVDGVSLATTVSDSGWKWLKGPYGTDKRGVKYRLKGGVVYIVADLDGDSNITVTGGGTSLGTLPEGYRPTSTILSACTGKSNNLGQLRVTSEGVVTAFLFGSNSVYFASSLTYPVG